MAKAYSLDLRKAALKLFKENKNKSMTSRILGITARTLFNWLKREEKGKLEADKNTVRRPKKICPEKLKSYVEDNPDATLNAIAAHFNCRDVSVLARLRKLNITYKKSPIICGTRRRKAQKIQRRNSAIST